MAALVAVLMCSALGACGEGNDTSEPQIGAVAWGPGDNCLYKYVGNQQYSPEDLCRYDAGSGVTVYHRRGNPSAVVYREDALYRYYFNTALGVPVRAALSNPHQIDVSYQGQWISQVQYAGILAVQRQRQQAALQQQAAQQRQQQIEEQQAQIQASFQESQQRVADIWLAPECTHSYNGCGP